MRLVGLHKESEGIMGICVCMCTMETIVYHVLVSMVQNQHTMYSNIFRICKVICWPLPSNQSFYRQIAGYRMGVGDHRVG